MIEANIDDMTGEVAGYVMEALLGAGALDVFYTSIYMKKNRPGMKLSVLCTEKEMDRMQEIIFRETTTLGIRMYETDRVCMNREWLTVATVYGDIKVKKGEYNGIVKWAPEYEDCKRCAEAKKVSIQKVYQAALRGIIEK